MRSAVTAAVAGRYGHKRTLAGVVKKAEIVRTDGKLRSLIRSYLNEEDKSDYAERASLAASFEGSTEAFMELVAAGKAPLRRGIDTVENRLLPKFSMHGHLNTQMAVMRTSSKPDMEEDIDNLADHWTTSTSGNRKKAYHFIFSMAPMMAAQLGERDIAAESVLLPGICDTFGDYESRFLGGATVGFVVGLHRDKGFHPHGHVLVYPRDSSGRNLNFSPLSKAPKSMFRGEMMRVDYQGFVQMVFNDRMNHGMEHSDRIEPAFQSESFRNSIFSDNVLLSFSAMEDAERRRKLQPGISLGRHAEEAREQIILSPNLDQVLEERRASELAQFQEMCEPENRSDVVSGAIETVAEIGRFAEKSRSPNKKIDGFMHALSSMRDQIYGELEADRTKPRPEDFLTNDPFGGSSFDEDGYNMAAANHEAKTARERGNHGSTPDFELTSALEEAAEVNRNMVLASSELLLLSCALTGTKPPFLEPRPPATQETSEWLSPGGNRRRFMSKVEQMFDATKSGMEPFPREMANRVLAPYFNSKKPGVQGPSMEEASLPLAGTMDEPASLKEGEPDLDEAVGLAADDVGDEEIVTIPDSPVYDEERITGLPPMRDYEFMGLATVPVPQAQSSDKEHEARLARLKATLDEIHANPPTQKPEITPFDAIFEVGRGKGNFGGF
jgi:hypothetical protein